MNKKVITIKQIKENSNKLFNLCEEKMGYGYSRWLDEKDYEDINEYAVLFETFIKEVGGKLVSMTKRPFGFKCNIGGFIFHYKVSSGYYKYEYISSAK